MNNMSSSSDSRIRNLCRSTSLPKLFSQNSIFQKDNTSNDSLSLSKSNKKELRKSPSLTLLKNTSNWKKNLAKMLGGVALLGLSGSAKAQDWPPNTQIFAAASQYESSYHNVLPRTFSAPNRYMEHALAGGEGGAYTSNLAGGIWDKKHNYLGEAHHKLENTGFVPLGEQTAAFPVSGSPLAQCLNTWKVGSDPHKKFALLTSGFPGALGPEDERYDRISQHIDLTQMQRLVKKMVPLINDNNISMEKDITFESLGNQLELLAKKINNSNVKEPEILLYFTGHGMTEEELEAEKQRRAGKTSKKTAKEPEGTHHGMLSVSYVQGGRDMLYEDELKHLVHEMLMKNLKNKDVRLTLVFDSCHSGALTK